MPERLIDVRQALGARAVLRQITVGTLLLALATLVAAVLEAYLGVIDASVVYLLAVVVMAGRFGTLPAAVTSVTALLVYDFLFTQPRFTLAVGNPDEWLSLLLFLVVAVVIGRLSARQAGRASEAAARARDPEQMSTLSRALAAGVPIADAAAAVVLRLASDGGFTQVWVAVGATPGTERVLASTAVGPLPSAPAVWLLRRRPGALFPEWVRTHASPVG